ncbi:NACHT domain-containing protein [Polyangium jinanense]|uniref:NACHT domain-containing protein n=1 Tax=Polyangium jinanense TaxID=2829994 RepID=A0A9X3X5L2_9BACT|nr:NACHT domain-containing protein [Polyangium jinanense]MDC3959045.1 NACHT domain-containing protein [Polyangium jinanense]MDC3984032.1 NACHT domain-containing protein [Polyangium jinanense]
MSFPLLVLHLSDLHFGPHGRFGGQDGERLAARFAAAIDAAREELGIRQGVGLVVVTGDIAEAARKNEYEAALGFFGHLDALLRVPRDRFVFVPGNHDVSWAETRKVQIEQEDEGFDDAELERRLALVRLARFEAFVTAFHGRPRAELPTVTSIGHGAVVHHFAMPDGGIAVAALNSCERESHARQGGSFGEAQAQRLLDHLRGLPPSWMSILAVHHNPITPVPEAVESWVQWLRGHPGPLKPETIEHFAADAAGFEGKEHLRAVTEDARVSVVLHGHHHGADAHAFPFRRGEKGHTLVLSSGSWGLSPGKLPESQPAMVHLLELDPARRQARSILRIYAPRVRAEGQVEPGTFAVDPASPRGATLDLYVPKGFGEEKQIVTPSEAVEVSAFVEAYRRRFGARYVRWDLGGVGVTQPSGGGPPVPSRLDEMFVPPRLGTNTDADRLDDGAPLEPFALATRETPLVIRGPAGCGKTTILRHCFRKLLAEGEKNCVPFLIELRELGRAWERAVPSERTLEAYLAGRLAEVRGRDERKTLAVLFDDPTGPRPILLVDGWDELGDLGDEVREKLMGLLGTSPRVLAVVTSRPYGESRPSGAEGFDVLDVQPLSDEEIRAFATRFHGRVHGEDEASAHAASERFVSALASSAEAEALARTALLLVMMLFVHRSRPLPDKRHELYRICLDNLLSARPRAKEAEGARAPSAVFRPEDAAERMRVLAELADRVQRDGYREQSRSPIVRTEDELCALLPSRFSYEERRGFIAWLVSSAGVLVDRADETFSFAHLSFQEYLVAHHWAAVVEGAEARVALCRRYLHDLAFWETLRLWAAVVEDRNPAHLAAVLENLIEGDADGFWLAGVMFADGLGAGHFEAWCARLSAHFHVHEQVRGFAAARAWAASRQEGRRQRLAAAWPEVASQARWLPGVIAASWWQEARLGREEAEPPAMSRLLSAAGEGQGVARGRALGGSSPVWPGDPPELSLLHLWPGPRGPAAARLQTLISLGGKREHLGRAARRALVPEREERDLARYMARYLARSWAKEAAHDDWVRTWALDLARDWAMDLSRSWAREWARDFALDLARYWARYLARYWTRDLARDWAFDLSRYWARDWAQDWVLDMAWVWAHELELPEEPWTLDFAAAELAGIGRAGTRAVLAFSEPKDPLLRLFHEACRLSLRPRSESMPFRRALAELPEGIDPLWPALARHVARMSTPEDRKLLCELAERPESREKPLSWGLRYYVRGDLVLDDGTEVELDELCDEAGIARLPWLVDMPDELDVEFD